MADPGTDVAATAGRDTRAPEIGAAGQRFVGVDLARGLAVVFMIFAHTSPSAIDIPTEYLTAPLFALLIGVGLELAWRGADVGPGRFILQNALRGLILIIVGIPLAHAYPYIDVVLQSLGVLTIVLAPLVVLLHERPRLTTGLAVLAAVLSPPLMAATRAFVWEVPRPRWQVELLSSLAAGYHYRLTSHLAFGLVGVVAIAWLSPRTGRGPRPATQLLTVGALAIVTVAAYGGGRLAGLNTLPYSGTTLEILGSCAFAAGAFIACWWLVAVAPDGVRPLWSPLVATGRMALTAYAVQILVLAAWMRSVGSTWSDNQWVVLLAAEVACVGLSWVWVGLLRRMGPLEWVLRLPRQV